MLIVFGIQLQAHDIRSNQIKLREWHFANNNKAIAGSFYMFKDGKVFIELTNNQIVSYPLNSLSQADQGFVNTRYAQIAKLNDQKISAPGQNTNNASSDALKIMSIILILSAFGFIAFRYIDHKKMKYVFPVLAVGVLSSFLGFKPKSMESVMVATNPAFIDSAFVPFKPNVHTFWNTNYFYVESKGIPAHQMMVGISNHGWQQQVPIPQCYIGNNSWPIPLNPVVASSVIPVDSIHFTRGAIAIAANGVPIFNVHTNTGVDSYIDGQLDNFGGHCGRADDYHYHIAPLHLYGTTTSTLPCAFALDGFAVYGSVEPDGASMLPLDANHGHFRNGVYHYHGTTSAPYMIKNMVGQVTEDGTHQLIPQAAASPVRTENWTPLNGALITSCVANGNNNGYNLSYSLNNVPGYATNFSWNASGVYTFTYVTPTNTTVNNYNGFVQCNVPLAVKQLSELENNIVIYPNPTRDHLSLKLGNGINERDVKSISIYNLNGDLIIKNENVSNKMEISQLAQGAYIVKIQMPTVVITRKLIVQ